jgi:hypothetical protein
VNVLRGLSFVTLLLGAACVIEGVAALLYYCRRDAASAMLYITLNEDGTASWAGGTQDGTTTEAAEASADTSSLHEDPSHSHPHPSHPHHPPAHLPKPSHSHPPPQIREIRSLRLRASDAPDTARPARLPESGLPMRSAPRTAPNSARLPLGWSAVEANARRATRRGGHPEGPKSARL